MTPRQEKLQELILSSSVLSTSEREEWLALLELMNDKQLSELEEILEPVPVKTGPVVSDVTQDDLMPGQKSATSSLPHIANLPTGLRFSGSPSYNSPRPTRPAPKIVPSQPVSKKLIDPGVDWLDNMKKTVAEKELPAPKKDQGVVQKLLASKPLVPQPPKPIVSKTQVTPTAKPSINNENYDEPSVYPTKISEGSNDTDTKAYKTVEESSDWNPRQAADSAKLTPSAYRAMGGQKVLEILRSLVKQESYVNVLINLEKSPLHRAYVKTGLDILNPNSSAKSSLTLLSKDEFSEVADIFRKIQVN